MDEQRRMFKKHPKTIFINAHMGWLANDLGKLGALLDEIPDVFSLLGSDRPPPKPEKPVGEKHPEIAAAEARLAQFLNFYDKKKMF